MEWTPAASPCVKLCKLDDAKVECLGCGRTLDEIAGWSGFDETARSAVLTRLAARGRQRGSR